MKIMDYHAKYYSHELMKRCLSDNNMRLNLYQAQDDVEKQKEQLILEAVKSEFEIFNDLVF